MKRSTVRVSATVRKVGKSVVVSTKTMTHRSTKNSVRRITVR